MDSYRVFVGLVALVIMGSLAFHLFFSPFFNDATTDADVERMLANPLYRASQPLALLAVWLCLGWGFDKMFLLLPGSWTFELESGESIGVREALGGILGIIATALIADHWNTLIKHTLAGRAVRQKKRTDALKARDKDDPRDTAG